MRKSRIEVEPGDVFYYQRQISAQRSRPSNITPNGQQSHLTQQRNELTRFPPAALLDVRHEAVGRHAEARMPTQEWISNGSSVCISFLKGQPVILNYIIKGEPGRVAFSHENRC